MKLSKTEETIIANTIFWGGVIGAVVFMIAFPVAAIIILLILLILK